MVDRRHVSRYPIAVDVRGKSGPALLLVFLAVGSILVPFSAQVHAVLATHAHVFCADHQRVEDAPAAVGAETTRPGRDAPEVTRTPAELSGCALSNTSIQMSAPAPGQTTSGSALWAARRADAASLDYAALSILRLAPKTSPPA